jgi:hypothetical protein
MISIDYLAELPATRFNCQVLSVPTFSIRLLNTSDKQKGYFEKLADHEELDEPINFEARFSDILDLAKPTPIIHHISHGYYR